VVVVVVFRIATIIIIGRTVDLAVHPAE